MRVKPYQVRLHKELSRVFDGVVENEWDVAKRSQDSFSRECYCPRLDIAIGPFNIDGRVEYNNRLIKKAIRENKSFLTQLVAASDQKDQGISHILANANMNPRCFLAIEIENAGSSKHMLGNIANVSIMGSIGVVIPFNDEKYDLCRRIKKYFYFARRVKKFPSVFENVLIIKKTDMMKLFV